MKKITILLILLFSSILSFGQLTDNMINNGIGQSKGEVLKLRKTVEIYPDTLNGVAYETIKSASGKVLERFFLTNIENKKDTQYCFHYRMTLVTTWFPYDKIENLLDITFKRQKNQKWLQEKDTITIIWTLQQKDYLLILNAHKQ